MIEKQKKQYKMLQEKANIKYIGKKYGRLTVLEYVRTAKKHKYFLCICDCGTKKEVEIKHLVSGATRSCGCLWEDGKHEYRKIHGYSNKERLYRVWKGMKNRCYTKSHKRYKDYGGRGIIVCMEIMNRQIVGG